MSTSLGSFPFGRPLRSCAGSGRAPAQLFVLGAYPSAVHVRWKPPDPLRSIQALAVDNEPEPFWNGANEAEIVDRWRKDVGWSSDWGTVEPAGRFNGSSGIDLRKRYLARFGTPRTDAWITDCLDTYHASKGGTERIIDTYDVARVRWGLPEAVLPRHPDEDTIIRKGGGHVDRLRNELRSAAPGILVTLGNAAMAVAAKVLGTPPPLSKLTDDPAEYGRPVSTEWDGNELVWYPLAHPAAPKSYRDAHDKWRP